MVPAETVDLPVPATAKIVIEGHIAFDQDVMEGPMNEYPGYNAIDASPKPLFTVTAITHRDGAILPVVAAGPPVEEDHTGTGTMHAAEILYNLTTAGLPVTSTWFSYESAIHWLIVSVRRDWFETLSISADELARRIGGIVFAGKAGFGVPKILLDTHLPGRQGHLLLPARRSLRPDRTPREGQLRTRLAGRRPATRPGAMVRRLRLPMNHR